MDALDRWQESKRLRDILDKKERHFHMQSDILARVMELCGYDFEHPDYYRARVSFRLAWEDRVQAYEDWKLSTEKHCSENV